MLITPVYVIEYFDFTTLTLISNLINFLDIIFFTFYLTEFVFIYMILITLNIFRCLLKNWIILYLTSPKTPGKFLEINLPPFFSIYSSVKVAALDPLFVKIS